MKIVKTHSVWNGLEYMYIQRMELWKEIENIIQSIDADKCKIKEYDNHSCYNQDMLSSIFQDNLLACQWKEVNKETAVNSYNQTDFVKNRMALEVQFGKYSFVAYDLFVKQEKNFKMAEMVYFDGFKLGADAVDFIRQAGFSAKAVVAIEMNIYFPFH